MLNLSEYGNYDPNLVYARCESRAFLETNLRSKMSVLQLGTNIFDSYQLERNQKSISLSVGQLPHGKLLGTNCPVGNCSGGNYREWELPEC